MPFFPMDTPRPFNVGVFHVGELKLNIEKYSLGGKNNNNKPYSLFL